MEQYLTPMKVHGNVVIHTGNILNINEVKMKAGQNTTEELLASLKYIIASSGPSANDAKGDGEETVDFQANKHADYHSLKLNSQEERKDVKVSVKVFVRRYDGSVIRAALEAGFVSLNTPMIESVVLALEGDNPLPFNTIKNAWSVLEEFVTNKKVLTIGVSDIDPDAFISLYEWAQVKPGIVQINLAHCCVVPPLLQSFTRDHDVQLLTHSDPIDILPDPVLAGAIEELNYPLAKLMVGRSLYWAIRYQIHIKCRGVLASKGYIMSLSN